MTSLDTTLAWGFKSELSLEDMKKRLDAVWPRPWRERDSDTKPDSISGALTNESSARIFEYGVNHFVVNLSFVSHKGDVDSQLAQAKKRLLEDVLPVVQANDVTSISPLV
jgi:hypothetical protein